MSEAFISLRPEMMKLIVERKETYEFRKYNPRCKITRFWIYIIRPVSMLNYIVGTEDPIKYPTKIPEDGVGNVEFNKGLKVSKYAFPISELYELKNPLGLQELRKKFNFTPPQKFIYVNNYQSLEERVRTTGLWRIF